MNQLKRIWKKGAPILVAILFLCVRETVAANNPPSSNVWLAVINNAVDIDARVSVTVPLAYGFVVNGTRYQKHSQVSISVDNNALLLPNYTVTVLPSSTGDYPDFERPYSIDVTGDSTAFYMKNYSTCLDMKANDGTRIGLPIELDAYIENIEFDTNGIDDDDDGIDDNNNKNNNYMKRHYWEAIKEKPGDESEYFKKYQIGFWTPKHDVEGEENYHVFSEEVEGWENALFLSTDNGAEKFKLAAPVLQEGKTTVTGLAISPTTLPMRMELQVGGTRGDYTQIEQSVKAGWINWIVIYRDPSA